MKPALLNFKDPNRIDFSSLSRRLINYMTSRLERLVGMQDEINGGRYPTVDRFCDMFEVQKRTIYEDIRILREQLGMEIAYDRFRNGYYNKNPKKQLPAFDLSNGEVFALTLGKEMLSQYTGTSFEQILRSALEKIYQRLPDRVEVDLDELRSMVKFGAHSVIPISRKMFLDLNRACEKNLPTSLRYFSASQGEVTERVIEPHRLLENRGTWYLVAYCRLRKDLRIFALHRIEDYRLLDERFTPRPDAEIADWLASPLFLEHREQEKRVKIFFDARAARYVRERKWHPSQKLNLQKDGSCTLEFTTPSMEEAKRWVLTFGAGAEVLEPLEFREMVQKEVRSMSSRYGAAV
jgi:predicted DNA-binding transcriptional regulator YafY